MAFTCLVSSPNGIAFNGEVWQVTIPGGDGIFSIRTGHIPLFATINKGVLEIASSENERLRFSVENGVAEFKGTICSILVEHVDPITP